MQPDPLSPAQRFKCFPKISRALGQNFSRSKPRPVIIPEVNNRAIPYHPSHTSFQQKTNLSKRAPGKGRISQAKGVTRGTWRQAFSPRDYPSRG
ncbi:hypothetical protein PVK06_033371 [Gossypium arboreum]|uniref:Uncharacterized protein n=1 Tax=Gossypium arboreum TaxID=29729 RepID=A0ABR0NC49_GOSAR|nr:hypothetical protein PVK06_033371 [Gossypium arboreum]